VDHADHDPFGRAAEPGEVGLGADHREGAPVNVGAVADVVVSIAHGAPSPKASLSSQGTCAADSRRRIASSGSGAEPASSAAPPATVEYPPPSPTSVRSAGPGCAQPLGQPETWIVAPAVRTTFAAS